MDKGVWSVHTVKYYPASKRKHLLRGYNTDEARGHYNSVKEARRKSTNMMPEVPKTVKIRDKSIMVGSREGEIKSQC